MKIDGPKKPTGVQGAKSVRRAQKTERVDPSSPVDAVTIAGVPEAELTPRVREALFSLIEEVRTLRAELATARAQMSELQTLADEDPLLGVLNRRAFVKELDRMLAMIERYGTRASLVFIDVNDLKLMNDRHGHAAGDAVLSHVASTIAGNIRQTDVFGRIGGDEFGLILLEADDSEAAAKAETLTELVAGSPARIEGVEHAVSISCGVAILGAGSTAEDALNTADAEMYRAKSRRKGDS